MKRMIKAEDTADDVLSKDRTFRIYFVDGNQKLIGGPGASILDAINYVLDSDSRYFPEDIYKVEEC